MNLKMLKAAIAGLVLSVSGFANAGLITETTEQTIDYQDFSFNWGVSDWLANTDATLTIEVQADLGYSDPSAGENFDIILESINLGTHGLFESGLNGWTNLSATSGINAWHVARDFNLTSSQMALLLSDNLFQLDINFNQGVDTFYGKLNNISPFVKVSLDYASTSVPEPSTLVIFALGMMGLASRRFKKQ
ncbi:PEP-CTERM sorting domain-containing protein [Thalassotalea piscium]|uniref:Ice-binding protein C-terminal domain-containing protein n=1 Tax=Thalassotalea piscium TaxID=1230533 RepID=A0A7X0TSV4_9GAMM|nr:PEP-CTERM sorting domain-containing protein [Thalassotalea piscium]MBB6542430.1 hypothetical protein [Thalassotalea piscium]